MKTLTLKSIILIITLQFFSSIANGQEFLSPVQWQEDLRFLQKTVHSDFPFLFKKVEKEAWDATVEKLYTQIPYLEEHEIKVGLTRMVSFFEYGHTQIPFSTVSDKGVLPINLYHFKDGIYVEGTTKENSGILGAKLLKVGEFAVDQALEMVRPVVPVENESYFKAYGLRFLTVPTVLHAQGVIPEYSEQITLTFEKEGKPMEYTLSTIPREDLSVGYGLTIPNADWVSAREEVSTPLYLKQLNESYFHFEYLPESKTLYARQSSVFDHEKETIKDFYKRLFEFIDNNEINKLIYDVRLNGGGNNYNNKQFIQGIMARPEINTQGKFFFIIGRRTFSACQNLTNEIENYTNAIMLGEPTAENKNFYGDAKKVTLPNSKINAYLSFAWWQDKPQWENADATVPHFPKELTFDEYRTNQDPVMDFALENDFEDYLVNPMDHFRQLFMAGEMEQLKTDAARILNDSLYAHIPFKQEFKQTGQNMLAQGANEGALFLYSMFTEYYPEDPEMWEGLGKAYKALGQDKEAETAFAKAAALSNKQ
ncbi:tetratricopeptide repeat protein [Maribacter aestuarii]|uniref:tetratricopeptide repeat protein n=1 Tax=Maribacter aestuarii TaxID=1130723 RepID=UPI00248CB9A8|nr:hypothetical protein [Maribacter aestuarii]